MPSGHTRKADLVGNTGSLVSLYKNVDNLLIVYFCICPYFLNIIYPDYWVLCHLLKFYTHGECHTRSALRGPGTPAPGTSTGRNAEEL